MTGVPNPMKISHNYTLKLERYIRRALFDLVKFENVCKAVLSRYTAENYMN
jgi:hypothetical protein